MTVVSGTGDTPVVACFNGCNVFTHVTQLEVKDGQGLIQVIDEANAVIEAHLHLVHQRSTLQDGMHISSLCT